MFWKILGIILISLPFIYMAFLMGLRLFLEIWGTVALIIGCFLLGMFLLGI